MKIGHMRRLTILLSICGMAAVPAPAQTLTTLAIFNGTDGYGPSPLVQGPDGNFYGATLEGGSFRNGSAFQMTPDGTLTTIYLFCTVKNSISCPSGRSPGAGLLLSTNGSFFGTTQAGGPSDAGTIFSMDNAGHARTIHNFCSESNCADGEDSTGSLMQSLSGNLYGTTSGGAGLTFGTIFEVTSNGSLSNLYSGCSLGCQSEGVSPSGPLVEGTDGNLYGTSFYGGANSHGTIFKITPTGTLTILYSFCALANCADGAYPISGLIQATDGAFYGVTASGGAADYGTAFRLGPTGAFTTLYTFCQDGNYQDCPDGRSPNAPLIQASDGNLYGTTSEAGSIGVGTLFKIGAGGIFSTVYTFSGSSPAAYPGSIIQGTNGDIYGTSYTGFGTIYSLALGLNPFVKALPAAGKAGNSVKILSQGLTGTSSVLFNGTAAAFQVVSDTYLTATIPAGATSGYISVTTSSGTLKSNFPFRVLQ